MDGWLRIKTKLDTKDFDAQIDHIEKQMEEIENKLKRADMGFEVGDVVKLEAQYEKLNNRLTTLKQKQIDLNKTDLSGVQKNIDKIGNSVSRTVKKVGRWALAIFGIRSAYNAVRGAMSLVESKNEEISKQIEVMKMAVANTLTPVIKKILDFVKTLMMYINYIVKRLTGKYLFNFTEAFNDVNKSSASTAKNVSKMTAGFDEMNVVRDTSSSGASSIGGAPLENPFEDWENFKPPKWLETITNVLDWIKKNWQIIVAGIIAIGGAFLLFKLLKANDVTELGTSFTGFFDSLGKGVEAIAILGGLTLVIKAVTDMIDTFSKSGLEVTDVLGLMGTVIGSVVVLITALTVATQFLQSPLAMAGLAVLTASISAILLVIAATLPTILDALGDFIVKTGPTLNKVLETIGTNISKIIYALGISLPPIINSTGNLFDKVFGGISKVVSTVGGVIVSVLNTAKSLVTTVLKSILDFINKLGPAINNFVDNAIKAVTKLVNFMISSIEYLVNTLIVKGVNKIIKAINSVAEYVGITIPVVPEFSIPRFVPKLAVGGIINMPGKGVPIGGAIGGEAGKEGVLPLTDTQAMEELGSTIGRYVSIPLTNIIQIDGRTYARFMKKVQANNDFAMNR